MDSPLQSDHSWVTVQENMLSLLNLLLSDIESEHEANGEPVPPPTAAEFVKSLEDQHAHQDKCPICLKEFASGEIVKGLPCDHQFDKDCLYPWLAKTSSCPVCRHQLPTDDPKYEAYMQARKREKDRVIDLRNLHNSMFT